MRYKKHVLIVLILVTHLFSCNSNTNVLHIVNDGVSDYEIVYRTDAKENLYEAAKELQYYIREISGATLNLVNEAPQNNDKHKIYIGNLAGENLNPNQIIIKVKSN
ncbi:hypothetical protein VOI54_09185 [Tamlana sp. 2201CG12-4]|uniref:hypothetical protein n=1 Tax=Tamlana sp. 2201CG12-4 TaxID=3112582 RepID=UPI002DB97B3A|nr:hypothetical protein [Tamlana sp. 2201CG12-4]MEC3907194.1 hypothetical protein [Tamlana sp. 2201CG12-4]